MDLIYSQGTQEKSSANSWHLQAHSLVLLDFVWMLEIRRNKRGEREKGRKKEKTKGKKNSG